MPITPPNIAGLIGWWKGDDVSGANGASANPWGSNASYGPDLDETAGTAPTIDTSVAINGINGIRFTGTRTLRDTTAGTLTGYTNGLGGASLFVVAKLDDASGASNRRAAIVATGVAGAGSSRYGISCVTGVPTWFARRLDGVGVVTLTSAGGSIGTSAPHILSGTVDYNSTTMFMYVDGAQQATSTSALSAGVTTTDSAGVGIGSHPGNATEGWPGVIYEVLLYDHALSAAHNEAVYGYLSTRYSIAVSNYAGVSPAAIAAVTTVPALTAGAGVSVSPAAVAAVTAVPALTAGAGASVSPSAVAAVTAVPAVTAQAGARVTPAAIAALVDVPPPSVNVGDPAPTTRRGNFADSAFTIAPDFAI